MRKLLLFWLVVRYLVSFRAEAQRLPDGPWRTTHRRVWVPGYEPGKDDWGDSITGSADGYWRVKAERSRAAWDVPPDSIRLFLHCENPLLAPLEPRPGRSPVRFAVTGATLRLDPEQHLLWIFPTAPEVVLTAYKRRKRLFSHHFRAMPPPAPQIRAVGGAHLFHQARHPGPAPMTVRMTPNDDFAVFCPKDARYRATRVKATLLRDGAAVSPAFFVDYTQQPFDLSELGKVAQVSDKLLIESVEVSRLNAHDAVEEVKDIPESRRVTHLYFAVETLIDDLQKSYSR